MKPPHVHAELRAGNVEGVQADVTSTAPVCRGRKPIHWCKNAATRRLPRPDQCPTRRRRHLREVQDGYHARHVRTAGSALQAAYLRCSSDTTPWLPRFQRTRPCRAGASAANPRDGQKPDGSNMIMARASWWNGWPDRAGWEYPYDLVRGRDSPSRALRYLNYRLTYTCPSPGEPQSFPHLQRPSLDSGTGAVHTAPGHKSHHLALGSTCHSMPVDDSSVHTHRQRRAATPSIDVVERTSLIIEWLLRRRSAWWLKRRSCTTTTCIFTGATETSHLPRHRPVVRVAWTRTTCAERSGTHEQQRRGFPRELQEPWRIHGGRPSRLLVCISLAFVKTCHPDIQMRRRCGSTWR